MNRVALLISILALTVATTRAQELPMVNPDVRTAGMADASVAVAGGTFSIYENAAAALFDYKRIQVGFTYTPQANGNYYAAGGYYSINERHTLEAGMRILNLADTGSRKPAEASADIAYALLLHDYAGISVTAHYIHGSYGNNVNYNALGIDIAVCAQIPTDRISDGAYVSVGAKVADVGFSFGGHKNRLPSRASAGAALCAPIGDSHSLLGSVDLGYRFAPAGSGSFGMSIGAEYTLMQLLSFRAGYHVADKNGFDYGTIGAGLSFMMLNVNFSYMFAAKNSPLKDIYSIGIGVSF